MPKLIAIEGDRRIEVGDAKQKVVELPKLRPLGSWEGEFLRGLDSS